MENPLTYQLLHLQFLEVALELSTLETQLLDGIFLQVIFSDPAMLSFLFSAILNIQSTLLFYQIEP